MATLTAPELEAARRIAARAGISPSWNKAQVNAALQAIETAAQATGNVGAQSMKAYIGAAVETAAPGVFNAAQKDDLFVIWCRYNVQRGGIL